MNVTNTINATSNSITLPFLGEITLAGGLIGIIFLIIGYFIGSSLRSGLKFAFIFLIFIMILFVLNILSKEIITRIFEGMNTLKSFSDVFEKNLGLAGLNFQMFMFFTGLIIGLLKG